MDSQSLFYQNFTAILARALCNDASQVFNSIEVQIRASDGFVNVSSLARAGGKLFKDYMKTTPTKQFLETLGAVFQGGPGSSLEVVVKVPQHHGSFHYWAHPLVAIDLAGWLSPQLKVQFLSWIFFIICGKAVALDTDTSPDAVTQQLKQMVDQLQATIAAKDDEIKIRDEAIIQFKATIDHLSLYKSHRLRPKLPSGSGVYVMMNESNPERCMIGWFRKSINERWQSYHTHSTNPMLIKGILYTIQAEDVEQWVLKLLKYKRPNTNESILLPYTFVFKMLKTQYDALQIGGETEARLLDEHDPKIIEFNRTTSDINPEDTEDNDLDITNCTVSTTTTNNTINDIETTTTTTTLTTTVSKRNVYCACTKGPYDNTRGLFNHVRRCLVGQNSPAIKTLSELSGKCDSITTCNAREQALRDLEAEVAAFDPATAPTQALPAGKSTIQEVRDLWCKCGHHCTSSRSLHIHARNCTTGAADPDLQRLSALSRNQSNAGKAEKACLLDKFSVEV